MIKMEAMQSSAGIFSWNGSAWIRLGAYIYGDMENDQSGESVSLSSDGSTWLLVHTQQF